MNRHRMLVPLLLIVLLLAAVPLVTAAPPQPGKTSQVQAVWPGPDGFGYTGAPADYQWIEISNSGTPVVLVDDDWDGPFAFGFSFPFYGANWTQFYVTSDGFLSLASGLYDYTNDCPLPNSYSPNNIIALMWDDLNPQPTHDMVYYQSFSTCPIGEGACLVVQYENYHHYYNGPVAGTFEGVLFAHGSILVQFEDAGGEEGSGSTTGIEGNNAAADYGLTYACDTPGSLSDGLAVCFAYPGSPGCPFSGGETAVAVDVKPRTCPNPVNARDRGALVTAVLGTADFDVTTIDPNSVRLRGAAPWEFHYEDVAAPLAEQGEPCECTTAGPDGYMDLVLHFPVQRVIAGPTSDPPGELLVLPLVGSLRGGGTIHGQDCVLVIHDVTE